MDRDRILEVFVKSNAFKEGDLQVGGVRDELERREARKLLAGMRLGDIGAVTFVEDEVSEALNRSLGRETASSISQLTVGELKRILLGPKGGEWAKHHSDGLSSEQIAAVVKLMDNTELSSLSHALFHSLPGKGMAIGTPGHLGSRIQPNSPGDDEEEILFSILEGLTYGCGDVILGINPASDDIETIIRLEELLRSVKERLALPVRYCVLSDIVKQTTARAHTRVEVGFQSLAGTSKALRGMVGLDVEGLLDLASGFEGLYFETGQGSAITNHAAEGVDMVTLESRNYGLARLIRQKTRAWMIVNDVAGFIGPEVFRSPGQLLRACLEDTVMAKLHGLTMGLDVCSTFHMGIDPFTLQQLTEEIVRLAAPAYLMAVAGSADPMLGYLTTSFREHPCLRRLTGSFISEDMQRRLMELGIMEVSGELASTRPGAESLYALFMRQGGATRSFDSLQEEGRKKIATLQERGFDLGYGHGVNYLAPQEVQARISAIYDQARRALYASIDDGVIRDASPQSLRARTAAADREDYLSHPAHGEQLRQADAIRVAALYGSGRRPQVQLVISDGLNANAVNENLRALLPPVKHFLATMGRHVGNIDIIVENGRVRTGYHIGSLLDAEVIVHIIGERPGTGLNTLSAYLTYSRDVMGESRWSPSMDHSNTTAICSIHPLGKPPANAATEIATCVNRILMERRSGVELSKNA